MKHCSRTTPRTIVREATDTIRSCGTFNDDCAGYRSGQRDVAQGRLCKSLAATFVAVVSKPSCEYGLRCRVWRGRLFVIPKYFDALLDAEADDRRRTEFAMAACSSVLKNSRTPFFPEFTDHSYDHINQVLRAAASLVPDEVISLGVLTSTDASFLSVGVLLHDLAMHLTPDGFAQLIRPRTGGLSLPWVMSTGRGFGQTSCLKQSISTKFNSWSCLVDRRQLVRQISSQTYGPMSIGS